MTGNDAISRDENLRTYLTGDSAAFADVCREFVAVYYPHGAIRELSVGDDGWADIWATVYVPKDSRNVPSSAYSPKRSTDAILFRFYRGSEVVGDRKVRDFFHRVRELKADRGVCVSAGGFHKKAHTVAMRIDLFDRSHFVAVLGVGKWYEFADLSEWHKFTGGKWFLENDEKFTAVGLKRKDDGRAEIWGLCEHFGYRLLHLVTLPHSNINAKQCTKSLS